MSRLTSKDYRDALDLVYVANRCQDMDRFINELFPSMIRVFDAECITLQLLTGYPYHIKVTESRSFKSDYNSISEDKFYPSLYKEGYYQQSPLLKEAINSTKTVLKIGDSISYDDWGKSELLNDFILPQHLYWELFLTLRWENSLKGMLTLWRSKRQSDYEDNDVFKAELIAPHIMVAIHNILLMSKINNIKMQSITSDAFGNDGLIYLDSKFKPYYSNNRAREICFQFLCSGQDNEVDLTNGELPVPLSIINDCAALRDLLKKEEPSTLSKDRILSTPAGRQFRIRCSLVSNADQAGSLSGFLVTISDLTQNAEKLESMLQAKYQLSQREMDVVKCLIKGMNEEEVARCLYISKLTVHAHVKNIYRKMGVKSRVELHRMIRLPSWLFS